MYAQLVGNSFRSRFERQLLNDLTKETELSLVRDPTNFFDSNAVKVIWKRLDGDHHLGFIEAVIAPLVAAGLDAGTPLVAHPFSFADPKRPLLLVEPKVE